jgi:ABC-type Mn2+/Zn2+ transport system ATPase subunit
VTASLPVPNDIDPEEPDRHSDAPVFMLPATSDVPAESVRQAAKPQKGQPRKGQSKGKPRRPSAARVTSPADPGPPPPVPSDLDVIARGAAGIVVPPRPPLPPPSSAAASTTEREAPREVETVAEPEAVPQSEPDTETGPPRGPVPTPDADTVPASAVVSPAPGAAASGDVLVLRGVTKRFGSTHAVESIDLSVPAGTFYGLVGPNGAGKTTILRAILGTLTPLGGTVSVASGVRFGYVPQRDSIDYRFPLSVRDVVLMGRYDRIGLGRRPARGDRDLATQALEQVGIADLAAQHISALSGGQKQRMLIARALVGEPTVLVLDEPTNGMDLTATTQILSLARDLHERGNLTVLMVSHALNEVANYVDRIALTVEGAFRIGSVEDIVSESTLSAMYGIPVEVDHFHGQRIVVAKRDV